MIKKSIFFLLLLTHFESVIAQINSIIEWQEVQKILASDGMTGDNFSSGITLEGNVLAIGARINPQGANDLGGVVYIFNRNSVSDSDWTFIQKIRRTDLGRRALFGEEIVIFDKTMIISAPFFHPDGPGSCNTGITDGPGHAFVYQLNTITGLWEELITIIPDDSQNCDEFGTDLQLVGDSLYVGSRFAPGISTYSGAAYVFKRNEGGTNNWGQVLKIPNPNAGQTEFGLAVAVDNNDMVIGERRFNNSTGIARLYQRSSSNLEDWVFIKNLIGQNISAGDEYGITVAIKNDWIAVGSGIDDVGGINATGSADIFYRNHGGADNWGAFQFLSPSVIGIFVLFGSPLKFDNERLYIGARGLPNMTNIVGSLYEYSLDVNSNMWVETNRLVGSDTESLDFFSLTFDVNNGNIIVGAAYDQDNGVESGSAYSFRFESDLSIIIDSNDIMFTGGDLVTYTISVQNNGNSLITGVTSELQLDTGLVIVKVNNCPENLSSSLCSIGDLGAGTFTQYQVIAQIGFFEEGLKTVSVTVNSNALDTDPSNNTGTETIEVIFNNDIIFIDGFESP
jgi:uncharacterized repeat protein (TIGR01451 family)